MFKDKITLVTGASRGLGRAVAEALGAEGAQIIALARTMGALEEVDDAIRAAGGPPATLVPLDLTDGEGLQRMAAFIGERWGRLDLLIHCAAHAGQLEPAWQIEAKDWSRCFDINAWAVQRLIAAADPLLCAAEAPKALFCLDPKADLPFWGAYGASKRAGESIARSYAAERQRKVQVDFFVPPPMPTALRARFWPGEEADKLTPCAEAAQGVVSQLRGLA